MVKNPPLVSIIIVSYNTAKLTQQCLTHALASSGFDPGELEVIVVDNHSTDHTVTLIQKNFPTVKVITTPSNLGFGAGNNLGVKAARGQDILLLNTDAFLKPETLRQLREVLRADPNALAVSPRLVTADGQTQQSLGYFPTLSRVIAWMWGLDKLPFIKTLFPTPYHFYDTSRYTDNLTPDWLMGAAVLLRRDDYLTVGGFNESIFMYGEEVELFYRLHLAYPAKAPRLLATLSITHLGSASTTQAKLSRLLAEFSGIKIFYQLHFPALLPLLKFVIGSGVLLRAMVFSLQPARRALSREYWHYFGQATRSPVQ